MKMATLAPVPNSRKSANNSSKKIDPAMVIAFIIAQYRKLPLDNQIWLIGLCIGFCSIWWRWFMR